MTVSAEEWGRAISILGRTPETVCKAHYARYALSVVRGHDGKSIVANPDFGDERPMRECPDCIAAEVMES